MSSINTSLGPVTQILLITTLIFSAVFCIDMGFTQIKRIGQEQTRYSHITSQEKISNDLVDFAHIEMTGKFSKSSHASTPQARKPVATGYAHVGIFNSQEFGPQLVMYNWDQSKTASTPSINSQAGVLLPFSLIKTRPIHYGAATTWETYFADNQIKEPTSFLVSEDYNNLNYFLSLYYPRYGTHYSYALQFFIMSITMTVLAGFLLKRGFLNVK